MLWRLSILIMLFIYFIIVPIYFEIFNIKKEFKDTHYKIEDTVLTILIWIYLNFVISIVCVLMFAIIHWGIYGSG